MSELLLDTRLDQEQQDCAENIQRSANGMLLNLCYSKHPNHVSGLLTVINDILVIGTLLQSILD